MAENIELNVLKDMEIELSEQQTISLFFYYIQLCLSQIILHKD